MGYQRNDPHALAAWVTNLRALLVPMAGDRSHATAAMAEAAGTSCSRIEQLANPIRPDGRVVDVMAALDALAARHGLGCPLYEGYRARLVAAGALDEAPEREALRRVARVLRRAAGDLVAILRPFGPETAIV
jgi:hypothetical protein